MKESNIILCGHGSGRPRIIRMDEYLTSRYRQTVTKNGKTWHKGVVAVMRPKGITDALRTAYVSTYKTILGRNYYSQAKRGYCYTPYSDGLYYSDCSSSQMLTLAKIGMDMPSYNTEEIFKSCRFEKVLVHVEKGHILNPEVLRLGDQLLFAGSDPSRELCIGHVEGVYRIDNNSLLEIVEKYQKFLNENYAQLLKSYCGGLLTVDGDYGPLTRAASVAILKYMLNKYYGAKLTPSNPNFLGATFQASQALTNAEVKKHPTLGYIVNGVLAGRGYSASFGGSLTLLSQQGIINLQRNCSLPQTGRLSADVWYWLFN